MMQFQKIRRMMKSAPPLSPHSLRSGQALSAAKGLSRWAERCFAEFILSVANVLSMTVLSPIRTLVGADLSCPAPMYRPRWIFQYPDYLVNVHYRRDRRRRRRCSDGLQTPK